MIKNPRVRVAKPRDVGLFRKLWKLFLEEQKEMGGVILPNEQNLEIFTNLFKIYTDPDPEEEAKLDGVVLFIGEVAVMMWGDPDVPIETTLGKTAYAYGIYVLPDNRQQGLSNLLHEEPYKIVTGKQNHSI